MPCKLKTRVFRKAELCRVCCRLSRRVSRPEGGAMFSMSWPRRSAGRSGAALDDVTRALWAAHAAGQCNDDDATRLSEAIQARRMLGKALRGPPAASSAIGAHSQPGSRNALLNALWRSSAVVGSPHLVRCRRPSRRGSRPARPPCCASSVTSAGSVVGATSASTLSRPGWREPHDGAEGVAGGEAPWDDRDPGEAPHGRQERHQRRHRHRSRMVAWLERSPKRAIGFGKTSTTETRGFRKGGRDDRRADARDDADGGVGSGRCQGRGALSASRTRTTITTERIIAYGLGWIARLSRSNSRMLCASTTYSAASTFSWHARRWPRACPWV